MKLLFRQGCPISGKNHGCQLELCILCYFTGQKDSLFKLTILDIDNLKVLKLYYIILQSIYKYYRVYKKKVYSWKKSTNARSAQRLNEL